MTDNFYAAPAAEVAEIATPARAAATEFHVISLPKFAVLFASTLGLYQLVWWHAHWSRYRRFRNQSMWPVARAIFPIFFAHSLTGEIDQRLQRGSRYDWSPRLLATIFVVAVIAGRIIGRIDDDSPIMTAATLATLLPVGISLARIQKAANVACDDPDGRANARFTWGTWTWLVIGVLLWTLIGVGLAMGDTA